MDMNVDHMQTLGVLAQVTHLSSCHAKEMFGKYEIGRASCRERVCQYV